MVLSVDYVFTRIMIICNKRIGLPQTCKRCNSLNLVNKIRTRVRDLCEKERKLAWLKVEVRTLMWLLRLEITTYKNIIAHRYE